MMSRDKRVGSLLASEVGVTIHNRMISRVQQEIDKQVSEPQPLRLPRCLELCAVHFASSTAMHPFCSLCRQYNTALVDPTSVLVSYSPPATSPLIPNLRSCSRVSGRRSIGNADGGSHIPESTSPLNAIPPHKILNPSQSATHLSCPHRGVRPISNGFSFSFFFWLARNNSRVRATVR